MQLYLDIITPPLRNRDIITCNYIGITTIELQVFIHSIR
jgi:hypothetical protein